MANPVKLPQTNVATTDSAQMIQAALVTLGGSGTTTAFTFAALDLYQMANTTYKILATANAASSTALQVTTKATTGFTLTHVSGSSAVCSVIIIGEAKRG